MGIIFFMIPKKQILRNSFCNVFLSEKLSSSDYYLRTLLLFIVFCSFFSGTLLGETKTMDETDLNRLHDIVVPESTSIFPLAAAWWIILAGFGIVLLAVAWKYFLFWRKNAYRRAALREYSDLQAREDSAVRDYAILLKRTSMAAFGRRISAGIFGEEWIRFLEEHVSFDVPDIARHVLVDELYEEKQVSVDKEAFTEFVGRWIKEHKQK